MRASLEARFRALYGRPPEIVTRAPGRIELIGNHTDYNGGPVIGAAIDRTTYVGVAPRKDKVRRWATGENGQPFTLNPSCFKKIGGEESWINYCLGMLVTLDKLKRRVPSGFDLLVMSDIPAGAGLSSSAALELASGLAFLEAAGETVPAEILVEAGREAENGFVGVPCGIFDQAVVGFGRKGHLVHVDSKRLRFEAVPLPGSCHFWIFNTQTKRTLAGSLYAKRHEECLEAARSLGADFLADVSLARLEAAMSRAAFKRARHVILECARVESVLSLLRKPGQIDLASVGRLLLESHQSSKDLFENSTPELDFLVGSLSRAPGVYGARLTGGGFGGAAMALTDASFQAAHAAEIAAACRRHFGTSPDVLHAQTANGVSRL